jgi:hypothetical protein
MKDNSSPYEGLPNERFWKSGVSAQVPTEVQGIYKRKFEITAEDRIATAGSCFAQHIARQLRLRGYNVIDAEPPPPGLTDADAQRFGYQLYSARFGNIYHTRQLLQMVLEANGEWTPADAVWSNGSRYFDALRPSVEPKGLASADMVRAHRVVHLQRVRAMLQNTDIFVFTLGLTEAWEHRDSGTVYPTAPGTIAGSYDPATHQFKNFGHAEIYGDFLKFRALLKAINPKARFILTVSPVPLTATATDQHILSATTYSKSVLRAVAGQLFDECADVDYFPSYELIATPFSRGMFYQPNLRNVTQAGVDNVMRVFFAEHKNLSQQASRESQSSAPVMSKDDVICEEVLLEAFGK